MNRILKWDFRGPFESLPSAVAAAALAICAIVPQSRAQQGDVRRVHDPAVIQSDGVFTLFSTGPGIPIRRSSDLIHWKRDGRVFEANPAWISREVPGASSLWAPDIAFFHGRYHLYYSASTFGSNRSAIGLATSPTLDPTRHDYAWLDRGFVVRSHPDDDFNAIDPNVVVDAEGVPWLAFGSFWNGIQLVRLDPDSGLPAETPPSLIRLAARPDPHAIEAPFLVRHDNSYFLFVSFDFCCKGVKSTYHVVVGRSDHVQGPYLDRAGRPMTEGGGTLVLEGSGRVRGPGHNAVLHDGDHDWFVHHFYDAEAQGTATLQIRPLLWDSKDGFPRVGEPLAWPVEDRDR
jgi:arabinan endo-1,5-alpha-L-arabinosidase